MFCSKTYKLKILLGIHRIYLCWVNILTVEDQGLAGCYTVAVGKY